MTATFLAAIVVFPITASAADPATITGKLVDQASSDPISGCTMSAHNEPFVPGEWRLLFSWETEADGSFSVPTNYEGPMVVSADCDGYFFEVFDNELFFDDGTVHTVTAGQLTALGNLEVRKAPALAKSIVSHFGDDWSIWPSIDDGQDPSFKYGDPGDASFVGDWDCDGSETPGLYRRSDGLVYLRNSLTEGIADISFFFGNPSDIPVAGDFNGDGCDTVSLYRPSEGRFYVINKLGPDGGSLGPAEHSFYFGIPGDKPFAGDFDGDGTDELGLHRESTGLIYYRNTLTEGIADVSFIYGNPGDQVLAADWLGMGKDTVAVFRPTDDVLYIKFTNSTGVADYTWPLNPGFDIDILGPFIRKVFAISKAS